MGTGGSEKMKYFNELFNKICLPGDCEENPDIFEIRRINNGIVFSDQVYDGLDMSKEDAIAALQEAIDWIKDGEEEKHPTTTTTQKAAS